MSEHAPGPWSIHPYVDAIIINDRDGVPVASLSDRAISRVGMPPENAKRIVTAVNCFDELLAALEACQQYLSRQNPGIGVAIAAEKAIKKARGE